MTIIQYNDLPIMANGVAYGFRIVIGGSVYKNYGFFDNMGRVDTYKTWIQTTIKVT